ncbi:M12 family metallopeptidase [Sphingobium sp. SJ10-10]|uniref:M12 family metallopeptidase n=1 Tax=Sphingobium sp. SJ10-10 TaxID=3114999 RepID=UPI002E17F71D|nr:M12 family metallopeptidase [Sphingobium sp. SJ10-10]
MRDRHVDHGYNVAMRFALAAALVGVLMAPPANASNTVTKSMMLWPVRKIPFTVCEQTIGNLGDLALITRLVGRGCTGHTTLSAGMAARVRAAVAIWNDKFKDNVTFEEVDTRGRYKSLVVFAGGEGCQTNVTGYAGQSSKHVNLADGCDTYRVLHEMLHVVGLHHEQKRGDRDLYLDVRLPTPAEDKDVRKQQLRWAHQYDPEGRCRGEYDFFSLMHYSLKGDPKIFPKVTLTDAGAKLLMKQGHTEGDIGQRRAFSDSDSVAVKALYPAVQPLMKDAVICPKPDAPGFQR